MIVNNEENNSTPLEAPLDTRKSVIEAPKVDLSQSNKVPPMPENAQVTPGEPEKKFSNKKAYKWLYDLNSSHGQLMSDFEMDRYANERISRHLPAIYRKLGMETPDNDGLISVYDSFFETVEVEAEKKNSNVSTSTTSSPSAPKTGSSVSESESEVKLSGTESGFQSPNYSESIPQYNDVTLPQLIKESDLSWITMNERDANLQFEREYGQFGFEAEQTDFGQNRLIIKAPDGTQKTVSLYTDKAVKTIDWVNYWTTGNSNTGDYRMDVAIDGLKDWMTSKVENIGVAQLAINNSPSVEMTAGFINGGLNGNGKLTIEEQSTLFEITGSNDAYNQMESQGFSRDESTKVLNDLYINTEDESEKQKIKGIADGMSARRRAYSRVVGGAIAAAPNGGNFDFSNNDYHMKLMMSMGMSPSDMSFGQNLLINDRVATYAEAEHLLSDYDGIIAVEKRDIKISINPDVQGEIASNMLVSLAELQERNNATPITELNVPFPYIQDLFDQTVLAGERLLDLGQTLTLSIADLAGNLMKTNPMQGTSVMGVPMLISKDVLKANDPDFQDLGQLTKELIKDTREEWLPYYDTGITDANSFAEVLAKGGNATMESLPITTMYMMNPEMGLALTFMNGYGETMYSLEKQQKEAKLALGENYTTTAWKDAELLRMANMSRAEQQAYAFTVGGIETGLTGLFTFQYFKGIAGAKNFAGAKSAENAKILANRYGDLFHKGFVNKLATSFGIQPKVLALEFMEEESIMLAQYAVDVAWGLKDFDYEEMLSMAKETGAQTFFTAAGIASIGTRVQNKRLNSAVDGFMRGNLTFNSEQESLRSYKTELATYENMVAANKKAEQNLDDSQNPITYSESQLEAQQALVDKFGSELMKHKSTKQDIIDEMTPEDKYEFLQSMADVKNFANTVKNNQDENIARAAVPKLEEAKERARRVMMKYPSSVSFDFMSSEQKSVFMQAAVDDLIENKYKGQDVAASFTTKDILSTEEGIPAVSEEEVPGVKQIPQSEIKEKAIEMYLAESAGFLGQDGEVRIIENTTRADAARGEYKIPREVVDDFNVQEHIDNIREAEKRKGLGSDVDLASEVVPEDLSQPDIKQESIDKESSTSVFEPSRNSKLVDRIETLNIKTDILSYLSSAQKSKLVGYLIDVEKGNKTKPGQVENLLDVIDMVIDIQTELGDRKIDIGTTEAKAAVNGIINLSLDMYSGSLGDRVGTLATTTVLMQNLFKDSKIGKSFIDLNNEAGRKTDEAKQKISKLKSQHTEEFALSAENDADYQNASEKEKKAMRDPNHINNNYEQMMLSSLRRLKGQIKNGEDVEFTRNKSLILQDLDIRRANYEADKKRKPSDRDPKYKAQYLAFKSMVDKLGIADAKSYEDVVARASGRNAELIEKFVQMQPNAEAMQYLERYADFDVTEMEVYLPSFYQYSEGQTYVDRIGYEEEGNKSSTAGQTKDATMPTVLSNEQNGLNLRLAPGNFFNQMYGSLQGLELEVSARDQYRQISEIMEMPLFQQMFEGNIMNDRGEMRTSDRYNRFSDAFKMRENIFEKDIKSAHLSTYDIGDIDPSKGVWSSVVQAAYSSASALVLTGVTQNIRQYQSAVSGVTPLLTSSEARRHLLGRNVAFYTGTAHATSGVEGKTWTVKQLRKMMGSNAYASNIYAKSRTGMRNSLGSELIVNQNRKMPMSYYLRNFGLVDVVDGDTDAEIDAKEKKVYQRFYNYGIIPDSKSPELYTVKQAMDMISASNEATLEVMLANGDRAAANATFESLYIDYRLKQGAKYDENFWENENKNPNTEAINYADQKIDETQKQTTSTSQAGLYSDYSSQFSNNLTKFVVPFGSFTFNTRSAILANFQKLQDPMLDPEQKQQSRRFLEGKVREIAYFEGLKTLGVVGLYQGVPGLARLFGAIDEDDIERYGGVTTLVGNNLLPIENRSLDDMSLEAIKELDPDKSKSTEEYELLKTLVTDNIREIEADSRVVGELLMTYENKLNINPYNINALEKTTQDLAKMLNPVPRPDLVDDGVKAMWNYSMSTLGMDDMMVTEFLTQDMKSIMTKDGLFSFIGNNAGIASILGQEYENLNRAITLSNEAMIYKRNTMSAQGVTGVAITSASAPIRERLDDATNMLLFLRLTAAFAPGIPKQDVNKVADKMERQLEEIYDAVGTDKMSFDPKDPAMKVKVSKEEKEQTTQRNSVLDQF